MAGEIQVHNPGLVGSTLYAIVRDSTGQVRDVTTSAWDPFLLADWGDYDIPLTDGQAAGYFVGSFPEVAAGYYACSVHRQAGESPAATDPVVYESEVLWDGSAIVDVQAIVAAILNEALATYTTAGTVGKAISDSGAAADPLLNEIPGDYESPSAGYKLGMLFSASRLFYVNQLTDGVINSIYGTDHLVATGNPIDIQMPTGASWPADLTGWTPTAYIYAGGSPLEFAGSVVTATGDGRTIRLEITAAQSATIPVTESPGWGFKILATKDSNTVELMRGKWASIGNP